MTVLVHHDIQEFLKGRDILSIRQFTGTANLGDSVVPWRQSIDFVIRIGMCHYHIIVGRVINIALTPVDTGIYAIPESGYRIIRQFRLRRAAPMGDNDIASRQRLQTSVIYNLRWLRDFRPVWLGWPVFVLAAHEQDCKAETEHRIS